MGLKKNCNPTKALAELPGEHPRGSGEVGKRRSQRPGEGPRVKPSVAGHGAEKVESQHPDPDPVEPMPWNGVPEVSEGARHRKDGKANRAGYLKERMAVQDPVSQNQ